MNKKIFIKDIGKEGEVNDYFLVVKKGIYSSRNNTKYMSVRLRDASGQIEGKIWDRVDELSAGFERNDIVYVESRARMYQENMQLTITSIRKEERNLSPEEVKEFYPESTSDAGQLRVIAGAEVVCVDGVDAVEAVVVHHAPTGRLSAVNASASARAAWIAGNNKAIKIPIMAMTTRSSTRVNPRDCVIVFLHFLFRYTGCS